MQTPERAMDKLGNRFHFRLENSLYLDSVSEPGTKTRVGNPFAYRGGTACFAVFAKRAGCDLPPEGVWLIVSFVERVGGVAFPTLRVP